MAKKQKVLTKQEWKAMSKEEKKAYKAKIRAQEKEERGERKKSKLAIATKETIGELKKVSWPSGKTVRQKTLVVLGVVVCFAIVIFVLDLGLSELYKLLTKGLS